MSNVVIHEVRQISSFDQIILKGFGDLFIKQGDEESLVVEAEEKLLPEIITEVRGTTLVIEFRRLSILDVSHHPVVYHLELIDLKGVEISGSGTLEMDGLKTDELILSVSGSANVQLDGLAARALTVDVAGSASVEITGAAESQNLRVSGSGKIQLWGLVSQNAKVKVSGSAELTLRAEAQLDVTLSGVATVAYIGNPHITQKITGIGSLSKMN
jgi:hypothetical protein